jgi:hypothetical protein
LVGALRARRVCELCILLVCVRSVAALRPVECVVFWLLLLACRNGGVGWSVHGRYPALASQAAAAPFCRGELRYCWLASCLCMFGGWWCADACRAAVLCEGCPVLNPWPHSSHALAALKACAISRIAGWASVLFGSSLCSSSSVPVACVIGLMIRPAWLGPFFAPCLACCASHWLGCLQIACDASARG